MQRSDAPVYGEKFDGEFDYDSHEWSCSQSGVALNVQPQCWTEDLREVLVEQGATELLTTVQHDHADKPVRFILPLLTAAPLT